MSFGRRNAEELLRRGVASARSDDPRDWPDAEYYLEWVLRAGADHDQQAEAWLWLAHISQDRERKRECLQNVLAIEPTNPDARREMAILDGRLKPDEMRPNPVQPGAPVTADANIAQGDVRRFPCPKCGAKLAFNPGVATLRCQFCGTEVDSEGRIAQEAAAVAENMLVSEQDWVAAIYTDTGHRWALPQQRVLQCQGCGATVTFDPGRASARCSYCGAPYVVRPASSDLRQPDGIVPFHPDWSAALGWARHWLSEQSQQPGVANDLAEASTLYMPMPVYLPFWTFNVGGEVEWRGWVPAEVGGLNATTVANTGSVAGIAAGLLMGNTTMAAQSAANILLRKVGQTNMVYTHGEVGVTLDDVPAPATRALPLEQLTQLNFDTKWAVPYREEMLAGWPAEVYTVSLADASLVARERALAEAHKQVALHTGELTTAASSSVQVNTLKLAVLSYKLLLFPVWIVMYRYGERLYRLMVSGQSGQVVGDLPRKPGIAGKLMGS